MSDSIDKFDKTELKAALQGILQYLRVVAEQTLYDHQEIERFRALMLQGDPQFFFRQDAILEDNPSLKSLFADSARQRREMIESLDQIARIIHAL